MDKDFQILGQFLDMVQKYIIQYEYLFSNG